MNFFLIFLSSTLKKIRSINTKLSILLILFCTNSLSLFSTSNKNNEDSCQLILLHETLKPIELRKAVIYYSASKFLVRKDSLCFYYSTISSDIDTIFFNGPWKYPVYLKLALTFTDLTRSSNIFNYDSQIKRWEVSVLDSSLIVKHKPVGDDFMRRNSLYGLVLIINTAIEMFLALIISRLFGWSHLLVFMVLAANFATFPVYIFSIPDLVLRESIVAAIKLLVMLVIGYRRIKYYKIIFFSIVLIIIGLGIKEFLFFLSYII